MSRCGRYPGGLPFFCSRWGSNHLLGICPLASLVISHPWALWYAPYDWGFSHCWLSKPSFSLSNFISDSSKDIVPFPLVKSYSAILKHLRTILHQFLRGFSDLQKRWCCVKSEKSNEFNRRLSNTRTVRKIQQDLRMIETSLQIFQCLPFWNLWFLFFSVWVKLPEMWLSHRNGSIGHIMTYWWIWTHRIVMRWPNRYKRIESPCCRCPQSSVLISTAINLSKEDIPSWGLRFANVGCSLPILPFSYC